MMNVIIDVGHYNNDSGIVSNGYREVDFNKSISDYCINALQGTGINITVTSGSLTNRTVTENQGKYDYFISIHNNGGRGTGTEVFTWDGVHHTMAKNILDEVATIFGKSRGIKNGNGYHVIKRTKCVSMIVECGFVDNAHDLDILKSKQKEIGYAIASGIKKTVGISTCPTCGK